ncbi:hypothetical protein [Undibacterium sp.]|uniref:hypothetical protein n=1 Tax=Undibacterium sp. TaxID=1914977 RepID=UPI002731499D|nr:hypothetical protein [Undibacterium sp.]MDP1980508.1 hypothetical protein [Undibacterium sp.]
MVRRRSLPQAGQMQINFFSVPATPSNEAGSLDVAHAVRDVLVDTLAAAKVAGHDRFDVATKISRLSNRSLTKDMLDQYCANSAEGKRFPLEALPALTVATGDYSLLEYIADACGCRILRGEEAMVAELGALAMQEKAIKERQKHINNHLPAGAAEKLSSEALKRLGQK